MTAGAGLLLTSNRERPENQKRLLLATGKRLAWRKASPKARPSLLLVCLLMLVAMLLASDAHGPMPGRPRSWRE
jgi:hypothetical protein